jgi:hypothetical protein
MAGVYTDQRLDLSKLGKACARKAKASNQTREIWSSGKRKPWWDCEPILQSKEQKRKPPRRGAPAFYRNNTNFDLNRCASPQSSTLPFHSPRRVPRLRTASI